MFGVSNGKFRAGGEVKEGNEEERPRANEYLVEVEVAWETASMSGREMSGRLSRGRWRVVRNGPKRSIKFDQVKLIDSFQLMSKHTSDCLFSNPHSSDPVAPRRF